MKNPSCVHFNRVSLDPCEDSSEHHNHAKPVAGAEENQVNFPASDNNVAWGNWPEGLLLSLLYSARVIDSTRLRRLFISALLPKREGKMWVIPRGKFIEEFCMRRGSANEGR